MINEHTVFVCGHGVEVGQHCEECRRGRLRGCTYILIGLLLFFVCSIATMNPTNKRAMCETMKMGDTMPLVCQGVSR